MNEITAAEYIIQTVEDCINYDGSLVSIYRSMILKYTSMKSMVVLAEAVGFLVFEPTFKSKYNFPHLQRGSYHMVCEFL